jgi:manganese transport protein
MEKKSDTKGSTVRAAEKVLEGKSVKGLFARVLPFLGPAFIASVAYVDPGNFATNIASGAKYGYMLLWVILLSNVMAMVIQTLSAKLGIATGKNLAEHCRDAYPRPAVIAMWIVMELVAMATDLAEFIGAAVGFTLLFGFPLWMSGLLTGVATFMILGFERYGFRPLEAVITGLVAIVAISYVIETILDRPPWRTVLYHFVVPELSGPDSVILAVGIVGATVMPHAIFLHSALTQGRIVVREPAKMKRLFHYELVDVLIAMGVASLVNGAMLVMAASTFHANGMTAVGTIEEAYRTLEPLLGKASGTVFAVSLLASGLSSASVGTMAGQVIMSGFLDREIPVWLRRLITMVPSLVVIMIGLDPTRTLVVSQVVLSFGLPLAVIPLAKFTSDRKLMGVLVNRRATTVAAWTITAFILAMNIFLLYSIFTGGSV